MTEVKLREHDADVWDECCKAFAWALERGSYESAIDYVQAHNPYRVKPEDEKPNLCDTFAWIGQPFTSCDGCGRPYWEHEFEFGVGDQAGAVLPIDPERAARVKAKWS